MEKSDTRVPRQVTDVSIIRRRKDAIWLPDD